MARERPIDKHSSPDNVLPRDKSPVPAVITVRAVVAQGEIASLRDRYRGVGFAQVHRIPRDISIARVAVLLRFNPPEAKFLPFLAVDKELWLVNPQGVPRQASQAFDVMLAFKIRAGGNSKDPIGSENEYVRSMWSENVVAELVDKELIAQVGIPAHDRFTLFKSLPRTD